jgi:hypothetical protein
MYSFGNGVQAHDSLATYDALCLLTAFDKSSSRPNMAEFGLLAL